MLKKEIYKCDGMDILVNLEVRDNGYDVIKTYAVLQFNYDFASDDIRTKHMNFSIGIGSALGATEIFDDRSAESRRIGFINITVGASVTKYKSGYISFFNEMLKISPINLNSDSEESYIIPFSFKNLCTYLEFIKHDIKTKYNVADGVY